jgi:poly-gamma-glutamate capsule biosynthesis protein CapA/YwtB (metallophosphatase superfamily)
MSKFPGCFVQVAFLVVVSALLQGGAVCGDDGKEHIDLVFAGDIMLADGPGKTIDAGEDPFAEFGDVLAKADVAIGNLECVIATGGTPARKPWVFRAKPEVLPFLHKHFDIVSLANNHSGDYGHDAFLENLDLLEKHKLPYFGGGRNCAHARMPHIIEVKGVRIALLGYNEYYHPRYFEAGPDWPGIAWAVDEQVLADIKSARTRHKADLVIPFMHWGDEEVPENDRQKEFARAMIDGGADMVIGAHPHVTQGIEYYKDKLIVYSLGNFVFDGFDEGPCRTGWVLRLRLDQKGLVAWDTVVAKLDERGTPHLMRETASPSGIVAEAKIEDRRGLIDSPLSRKEK